MKLRKLAAAVLLLLAPALVGVVKITQKDKIGDKVTTIVDGDTFKLENKQTIRLASVDAPETGNCGAEEAKRALADLLLNKRVILQEPYADKYGRVIALVVADGQIINEVMVRNGLAEDTFDDFLAKKALQDANDYARKKSLGIYSKKCSQTIPPNTNCLIKGNHDQRKGRPLYSYPGCTNYYRTVVETFKGDRWFCSEEEAEMAGYEKSGDCQTRYNF